MILFINNIDCKATHGCLAEEKIIGQRFSVDVELHIKNEQCVSSDNLVHTADYVAIHNIVRHEMGVTSNLIEHVAGRILQQLQTQIPIAEKIMVRVTKYNPPVNGYIGNVVVELSS